MNTKQTHYDEKTPAAVREIIEREIHSGRRLRVFYGDQNTGRDWCEEWMNQGYIGRSTGTQPIPLLVNNSRSTGGPGLLDSSIVKITHQGRVMWQHPSYNHPKHTTGAPVSAGYVSAVYRDGELCAQFKKAGQAERWIDFIEGRRDSK
jgi:hypothetical protein